VIVGIKIIVYSSTFRPPCSFTANDVNRKCKVLHDDNTRATYTHIIIGAAILSTDLHQATVECSILTAAWRTCHHKQLYNSRRRLQGGDRPYGQKAVAAITPSCPTGISLCNFL